MVAVIDELDEDDEHTDTDAHAVIEPTTAVGVTAIEALLVADGEPPNEPLAMAVVVSSLDGRDDLAAEGEADKAAEGDAVALALGECAEEDENSGVKDDAPVVL